jgi:hypothetical protein
LVVFQFAASIILISSTLIIRKQMRFIHNADLGFQPGQIFTVPIRAPELARASGAVKAELLRDPRIAGVTVSSFTPGSHPNQSVDWEDRGENEELMMAWYAVDHDFVKTFGIDLLAGRDFSTDFPSDLRSAYILNEAAVKVLGWSEPVGKHFQVEMAGLSMGTVVGVMKDFHFDSLHCQHRPARAGLFFDEPTDQGDRHPQGLRSLDRERRRSPLPEIRQMDCHGQPDCLADRLLRHEPLVSGVRLQDQDFCRDFSSGGRSIPIRRPANHKLPDDPNRIGRSDGFSEV